MTVNRKQRVASRMRQSFVAGLIVILPLFITALLLRLVIGWLRSILHGTFSAFIRLLTGPALEASPYFGAMENAFLFAIGLPLVLLFILLVGWLARQYAGQRAIRGGEDVLAKIPIIGGVYDAAKQLVKTIFGEGGKAYRGVVLVEYPRKGSWMIGFVTSESRGEIQMKTRDLVVGVFVPTTPNPTSGFLLFVPRADLVPLEMSVEDGIKMVVSGGVVEPPMGPAPAAISPDPPGRTTDRS